MICKFPDLWSTWCNNTDAYLVFSVQPRRVWTASQIISLGVKLGLTKLRVYFDKKHLGRLDKFRLNIQT
jgi:hypothetical protein